MRRRSVLLLDEMLCRRDEIVEHILFVRQISCLVPLLPVFSAAAQVRDGVNSALIEPKPGHGSRKTRSQVHAVATISIKDGRIRPVELRSLAADDVYGNLCTVFRSRKFAHHLGII